MQSTSKTFHEQVRKEKFDPIDDIQFAVKTRKLIALPSPLLAFTTEHQTGIKFI